MSYSSLLFIYLFFPAALGLYMISPKKFKDIVLYVESLIFCGFMGIKMMLFILLFTIVNYTAGQFIYSVKPRLKSIPLAIGILFDIIMLLSFRADYFAYLHGFMRLPEGAYPLGISLFTLSAVGYLADIYKGNIRADKNFIRFSLFVMMFPRLIMGTVVSYDTYLTAMKNRRFNIGELGEGIIGFVKGLAKKVIVADQLYMLYSAVSDMSLSELSAASAWLGIIAYILCLYFTLSGLSDMSCGLCRCFGIRIPNGFNYPMFSGRIRVFLSKWHIQVIQWFRKYITTPVSSMINNAYIGKLVFVMVWTVTGLWYSFSTGGALWGMLMGLAVVMENKFTKFRRIRTNGIIFTMFAITLISVFLAAESISGGLRYMGVMFGGNGNLADSLSVYLLKYYIVILLVAVYGSTDLFKNMLARVKDTKFGWIISVFTPVTVLALLLASTALMAYSGQSDSMIIML